MVLLEKRPYLLLLLRSQLQVFCEASKFLFDRLRRVNALKLLARGGLLHRNFLSRGNPGHPEREHHPTCKRERTTEQCEPGLHVFFVPHAAERNQRRSREIRLSCVGPVSLGIAI
ncbi:MAG: hypothetical protein JWM87_4841 [Candidatus Eremiobacteraeota bacterium]|nr:hypothetical protein [Candidatus Eremiobacteraeota bacterium]